MNVAFRPLTHWPRSFTKSRRASPFRAGYNETIRLMSAELTHLGAKDVVIQTAMTLEMIRQDGLPRAGARPAHPGVIVSFTTRAGSLSFPCDRFADWESNLRAIALSLEALRRVDRYGVTQSAEQYRGWQALPAPPPSARSFTHLEAAAFISGAAGAPAAVGHRMLTDRALIETTYRAAAAKMHPDAGGSHEDFVRLQQAKAVLDEALRGRQ